MVAKTSSKRNNGIVSNSAQEEIKDAEKAPSEKQTQKRTRVSQSDVPSFTIDEALRVPLAIIDNYASKPTRPLDVAAAMDLQPTSGTFRMLTGAAIAYGLTEGGANAPLISVKQLARRILMPLVEGDDIQARREALLIPRVPREFLKKYDGNKLPRDEIAKNVLLGMGVPRDAVDRTLKLITESAKSVSFLREIKGSIIVDLQGAAPVRESQNGAEDVEAQDSDTYELPVEEPELLSQQRTISKIITQTQSADNSRVFITHGKNKSFVEPLKEILVLGELDPIVAVERESVSQPLPDKVMNDMRSCSSAIIHVEDERKLFDQDGKQYTVLNSNVLIEIGAAMALYDRKFILLVKSGVELPSNLQGLYRVSYDGDKLDGETTIRLLKAIKELKKQPYTTSDKVIN